MGYKHEVPTVLTFPVRVVYGKESKRMNIVEKAPWWTIIGAVVSTLQCRTPILL